jgi:hypothetical protein
VLLFVSSALLSACGGGGDKVSTEEALEQASRQIVQVIDAEGDGLRGAGADSGALGQLLEPFGITLADNGDEGLGDDLEDLVELVLDEDHSSVSRRGDTLTVTPSPPSVCGLLAGETGFDGDPALHDYCLRIVRELRIVIDIEDDDRGLLIVRFGDSEPLMLRYSPGLLVLTIDVAEAKAALDHLALLLDDEAQPVALSTLEGRIRVTLRMLGPDHGLILVEVIEDIVIADDNPDEPYDIRIAAGELLRIEADGVSGEASVRGGIGALEAHYPQDIDDFGNTLPATVETAGIRFALEVSDGGDSASGEFLLQPLSLTVDGEEVMRVSVDDGASGAVGFSLSVDADSGGDLLTLDTAFDLDLMMNDGRYDLLGEFMPPGVVGTLAVTAASGTSVREYPQNPDLSEVVSGAVDFDGTGDFSGYTGTAGPGACFNEEGPQACAAGF